MGTKVWKKGRREIGKIDGRKWLSDIRRFWFFRAYASHNHGAAGVKKKLKKNSDLTEQP